jgi:thiol-disulfide isomerase/thioredoxin
MFKTSAVVCLKDDDFIIKDGVVKVVNPLFAGKNGYIMFFAPWCPHCRSKEDFWSYLGSQFNENPEYQSENFQIGSVDCDDDETGQVCRSLEIGPIPKFFHVYSESPRSAEADLIPYEGEMTIESLLGGACERSSDKGICNLKSTDFNPPPISYN